MDVHIDELIRRYPLHIMPVEGTFHALLWYTHNEGHHLILSATEERVCAAYRHALFKNGGEAKEFWRLTIIAPPREYIEAHARAVYASVISQFSWWVTCISANALIQKQAEDFDDREKQKHDALAAFYGFRVCPYVAPDWFTEPPEEDDDLAELERRKQEAREAHECCGADCKDGVLPASGTWADLYENGGREVMQSDPTRSPHHDGESDKYRRPAASGLPAADPTKPIYIGAADFGHHSRGLVLRAAELPRSEFQINNVLFFFQGEKLEMPPRIGELVEEDKRLDELAKKQKDLAFHQRKKDHHEEEVRLFNALFPHPNFLRLLGQRQKQLEAAHD